MWVSTIALIKGLMKINQESRFTLDDIKGHPWYVQDNPFMTSDGLCRDGVSLATRLVEGLHVDFSSQTLVKATPDESYGDGDAMMVDEQTPHSSLRPPAEDTVMATQSTIPDD